MAVNVSKNRLNLLTAYQDVIDETSSTNWALYTYEDSTDDLTLASSGDGGLPEITVSFDNTQVMYGFCSMKEPNAVLPRYVLINWVGEDVPDARKCACASHVSAIADFFQVSLTEGVDVVVNASSMEDIDPVAIGQRLTNGTAVIASPVLSRLRIREEEQTQPVGTCYEKTNAEIEMKKINREEFWEQAKRDEEMRKEEERRKALEERQRFEEERMELERREQEEREKRYREREMQIEEHRRQQQSKEVEDVQERTKDQSIFVEQEEEASQQLKKMESEVEEAAAIIAQRTDNPREYFKQRERAVAISFDSSPLSSHRAGRLESPFLKLHHSLPEHTSPPPCSPLLSPALPLTQLQPSLPEDDLINTSPDRSPTPLVTTPIPRIVTTPIFEDPEDDKQLDSHNDWAPPAPEPALPSCVDSSRDKPVQSVAPQIHEEEPLIADLREMSPIPEPVPSPQDPTGSLLDLWDSPAPQCASEQLPLFVEAPPQDPSSSAPPLPLHSEPPVAEETLLSFDDLPEPPATFCEAKEGGDNPPSLVDIASQQQMTLDYHRAQHEESGSDSQDKGELLMTNGETLQKEGTQASEGYFSQSQEEEFAQSEESSAKGTPGPIFYNKPPEIDITCWDTDPVTEEDEYGAEE
ncbi:drebrin-like isoform X1 [Polyodon spathula]|uniref:drebrin-like isoform X1 n=1 Tax=Polyodon spathula TaxID=7913 RepID=UPI001B7EDF9E|nr:drebrin-like isoform X1 [Polyodon spathula]